MSTKNPKKPKAERKPAPEDEDFDYAVELAKFRAEVANTTESDNRKDARKARKQTLTGAVDRRALRATGRTEQFNFRSVPRLKARAQAAADKEGITLGEWMERAVEAALGKELEKV